MRPATQIPTVIRFEDYELDLSTEELRKNGSKIRLRGQPFQVLAMLLERPGEPGEIVTREELCRVALGRELNAFDRSVDNLMASLRKKLCYGDSNGARIQSARGRGYVYTPR